MLNKILVGALLLLLPCASAYASPVRIDVSIGTSDLAGADALLAFDLVDGDGAAGSMLTLSLLDVVGGSLGGTSTAGDASGDPATSAALGDTEFFNELSQSLTLGSSLSFTLDVESISLPGGPVPDAFSLFLLDAGSGLSLVTTDLPGDALLTLDLTDALAPVPAGQSEPTSPRLDVIATLVPEPSAGWLLGAGLAGALLAGTRRRRTSVGLAAALLFSGAASAQTAVPVDASVSTSIGGLVLDRASGTFVAQARITNHSAGTLGAPLSLAITSISRPGVTLANASGADAQGPFVSVPLPVEGMVPGARLDLRLAFSNPSRARFTFTTSVRAVPLGSGITLPTAVRLQALDDLAALATSVAGMPEADRLAAFAQFVSGRPEFSSFGDNGADFWATFTDGRNVSVIDNRGRAGSPAAPAPPLPPLAPLGSASPSALPVPGGVAGATELPGSNQVRLISAMGRFWVDPRSDLADLLIERIYEPHLMGGEVEDMKHVGGDGVLFISSHGAVYTKENETALRFKLWTSTLVTTDNEAVFAADLSNGRLVYTIGQEDKVLGAAWTKHYAITADFVEHYWKPFARNSLVFIDACFSAYPGATDFQEAVKRKGASVYMGWSDLVHDTFMADTVRLMFDRLLGADRHLQNGFSSENPPERPFPWPDVLQDLPRHGLAADDTGAKLLVSTCAPKCQTEFGLLAPSIWMTSLNPDVHAGVQTDKMYISGSFGEDPGGAAFGGTQRAVLIDGTEVSVDSWAPTLIVAQPPATGAGSVGEVLVRVRDHVSNGAMLSEWHGVFTTVARGPGSLRATIRHDLRMRADIRATRAVIHDPPVFQFGVGDMLGSRVRWACTGQDIQNFGDSTWTTSWSGSRGYQQIPFDHTLPVATFLRPNLLLFTLPGVDDVECLSTLVVQSPRGQETITSSVQLAAFTGANENVDLAIGQDWQILGHALDPVTIGTGEIVQLSYPDIPNTFPPDPTQGR